MERRDKQAINSFTAASSGVGATKAEAGRKRPRDDSGPPNAPPRRSGPYSGLALNNLHDTNRSSHKGSTSNSRTSQPSARGPSRATQNNIGHPIASTIFYANHSKSELSLVKPQLENSTTTSVSHEASNNVLRYPDDSADLMPPENLSHKTNALMSGHPEDMYSLADIFDAAPAPASPSGGSTPELLPFHRPRKSSSADPIDIIDRPTSGPSAAPLGSTDDDPIEEIGEGDRPSQHRPGTPKRETQFQKGRVKRAVESLSQAAAGQSTLNSFLKTQPPNSAHSAFESMAKTKSSSIGIPITPGMTRPTTKPITKPVAKSTAKPTTISGRMGKKSGLVIQQPGSSLQPVSSQRPTRPRDSGLKRQPHTAPSASVETSYLVQEWYCANERYETSRDRQNPYWLVFDGSKLRLARGKRGKDPQVLLTLLQLDFEEFTIAQSAPENNTEEFIASIYFTVKDKCASSESWKKLSNESTFPKMLVTLDTATENDTPDWESLVRRLAGWITKATVQPAPYGRQLTPSRRRLNPNPSLTHLSHKRRQLHLRHERRPMQLERELEH
ncbi:hypothetical protein BDV93DRAFT_12344 [Ceratobasidium sp. AG-I]|nr:hypothetical protein BDV93DRAFT_12344 [Ceratobasidium sp. AG-I]